ncbi:MAG: hypothetical protein RL240_1521, partial [Planctomycetota bacterium]
SDSVPMHSIIGTGGPLLGTHRSDGVVPYDSAHWDGVQSERTVPTTHSSILTNQKTVEELVRILREHRATAFMQIDSEEKAELELQEQNQP